MAVFRSRFVPFRSPYAKLKDSPLFGPPKPIPGKPILCNHCGESYGTFIRLDRPSGPVYAHPGHFLKGERKRWQKPVWALT